MLNLYTHCLSNKQTCRLAAEKKAEEYVCVLAAGICHQTGPSKPLKRDTNRASTSRSKYLWLQNSTALKGLKTFWMEPQNPNHTLQPHHGTEEESDLPRSHRPAGKAGKADLGLLTDFHRQRTCICSPCTDPKVRPRNTRPETMKSAFLSPVGHRIQLGGRWGCWITSGKKLYCLLKKHTMA